MMMMICDDDNNNNRSKAVPCLSFRCFLLFESAVLLLARPSLPVGMRPRGGGAGGGMGGWGVLPSTTGLCHPLRYRFQADLGSVYIL